ncbi:restriction endonuclease subunit S [Salmonella enterica subsp. enterica serovar Montevideo]|uniref:Restriction endonuclease subunit S n=2 Tax=Salmonella enterica I TaxID=59201 RepID=A0A608X3V9_SALMO|nr:MULTISPECIES: restriction endonuclease subunit S [Enterobacteriaceae]EAA8470595.1 restriction endonuclease subunit S [Salmonella enterica]EAU8721140.1 restriction endonuclease subunit S [Salmonella enterica subsp. enterica serovar Montevideo]EBG9936801.1 restriction endonuclease subunit S [Salmonella enterica subsp. enterica serovar Cerro]ECE1114990.1 restriction endonuclease subunit S [Salmonella enterica subsp. enterica]ECK7386246.1 restriction endonuclease subunit S [Salmonella enterica 
MSELSYLEKLLDGAEVEWLPLSSLCNLITTGKLNANAMEDNGAYPFFTCNEEPYRINTYAFDLEAILISGNGSQVGHLNYYNGKFNAYQRTYILGGFNENVDIMYLYYYLMHTLKPYIHKNSRKGSVPYITMPMLENFKFPIPCPNNLEKSLAIQSEIVRILDKFTALTAELTAELTMRKKQYNYYRDQLLSFDNEDVPHLPMGQKDIGEFIRGGTFQKKDFMDAGVGCIHYGQIYTYYGTYTKKTKTHISAALAKKCKKAQKGNLIIATTSENDEDVCKAVAWLGSDDIAVSSDACIYKHNLNPKYVSYYFQTEQFQNQKRQYITGAKVRRVNADNLSKILIPVPSMAVQERIVSILDKFDTLTNSITEGLPREIELRQKQYEYYRDLLFSFPKPETASN